MGTVIEEDDTFTKALGRGPIFYYGMGHMLNDITSACWFTYLLLFLTDIGFSPRNAAIVMLSGQVADAFATVFVGELTDLDISRYGMGPDLYWWLFHFLLFLVVVYHAQFLLQIQLLLKP